MSWQAAAFAILAVGLAGGFAWYERTRPDARIVALVGTLAAFAALGRIAFAALPNVKPTTDIVLISGYALGAGPGFVVGAVAGLTSNFFFGQGPWTPWQMAAWGTTGLIGAGLALGIRRRAVPNRWVLAAVCAVSGFAFTAVQDVGDWVNYSDHSVRQLGVYVGKGVGFDLVHAISCALFALAFGPALTRSIRRFSARIQVRWVPLSGPLTLALVLTLAAGALLAGQPVRAVGTGAAYAATTPTDYLLSAQNADGGFGAAPGGPSSQLYSGWAALGLAAEGHNPNAVRRGSHSLGGYVLSGAGSATDPGSLEREVLALRAGGLPASAEIVRLQRDIGANGSVSDQVNLTSFAILALRAAGQAPPAAMTGWLIRQQDSDGGFNFATRGGSSDIDDTGAALEALAGTGGNTVRRAVRFLDAHENSDGGFPSQLGGTSNAQSTAWAIQGLIAAGQGTGALGRPLGYLHSLIAPDGHVRYARGSDQTPVWVTAEALMALAGKPLPLAPVATAASAPRGHARSNRSGPPASKPPAAKRRPARARHRGPASRLQRLAADVAVLDALMLAPVR